MEATIVVFTLTYMQWGSPKSETFDSPDEAIDFSCTMNAHNLAGCFELWEGETLIHDGAALSDICFEKHNY